MCISWTNKGFYITIIFIYNVQRILSWIEYYILFSLLYDAYKQTVWTKFRGFDITAIGVCSSCWTCKRFMRRNVISLIFAIRHLVHNRDVMNAICLSDSLMCNSMWRSSGAENNPENKNQICVHWFVVKILEWKQRTIIIRRGT